MMPTQFVEILIAMERWKSLRRKLEAMAKPDVQTRYLAVDALAEMSRIERGTK
jgi:hypothetical protein